MKSKANPIALGQYPLSQEDRENLNKVCLAKGWTKSYAYSLFIKEGITYYLKEISK